MLAVVLAGGGANEFKTLTLFNTLAGSRANEAFAELTRQLGAPAVKAFIITFDFFVVDALRLFDNNGVRLPATAEPEPKDGVALFAAMLAAGVDETSGTYTVGYMLDHLVSHRLHLRIISDINAKYGSGSAAAFALALHAMMNDLRAKSTV